jgi:hypothetical protein
VILEEDGSALQVQPLKNAIKSALHRKGARRAKKELNEEVVGGDTVGVFNKAKHKCTYMYVAEVYGLFPLLQLAERIVRADPVARRR